MAKIQNPQNERGETLATDKRVNELIEERLVPVEDAIETIISETIPESKIDVENLDDVDFTPINTFTNLNKIQFAGKYVNVVANGEDGIRVYINEDNSLPQWDGKSISIEPTTASLYVYGIPSGAEGMTGNNSYSYVHNKAGVSDITLEYNGEPFTLLKGDYSIEVSYKLNGTLKSKTIDLVNEIKSEEIPENSTPNSHIKDNFTLEYTKLGYDVAPNGKTPGNLEVSSFIYVIPAAELAEGQIKDITITFKPTKGVSYTSSVDLKIYFWTTDSNNKPSGSITLSETKTDTIYVSGLQYHKGTTDTTNKIVATINGSNLADGALTSNTISIATSGLKAQTDSKALTNTTKAQTFNGSIPYSIPTSFKSWGTLTVTATYPLVVGTTGNAVTASATSGYWNIHPVKNSTDLIEYFVTENKRLTSSWTAWTSSKAIVSGECVVQNGKLYHTKGSYEDGGIDFSAKKNWKSLTPADCSFYRIFKDTSKNAVVNDFYIDGINSLLGKEGDVEIIVSPYIGSAWSNEKFIANKIQTSENNGLAASATVNGKIKCSFPAGKGTLASEGIRMEIKIKNKTAPSTPSTVSQITISF